MNNGERFGTIRADLTHRRASRFANTTEVYDMAWSPDGRQLIFQPNQVSPD